MHTYIHAHTHTYVHKCIGPPAAALPQLLPHRPVFNLLLDAMTGVGFSSKADEDRWNDYDPAVDFERGGEVGLADVVGSFLHTKFHSSSTPPLPSSPPSLLSFLSSPPASSLSPSHTHIEQCAHEYLVCLCVCVCV